MMKTENIESRYRLLHLIYEGKTSDILTDQGLRESLNDLMKHELITIYNNKLKLTESGMAAMKNGINTVITKVKSKKLNPIEEPAPRHLVELMVTIAVLLLVILVFMIF